MKLRMRLHVESTGEMRLTVAAPWHQQHKVHIYIYPLPLERRACIIFVSEEQENECLMFFLLPFDLSRRRPSINILPSMRRMSKHTPRITPQTPTSETTPAAAPTAHGNIVWKVMQDGSDGIKRLPTRLTTHRRRCEEYVDCPRPGCCV